MQRCRTSRRKGRLVNDAAESLVIGLHVARRFVGDDLPQVVGQQGRFGECKFGQFHDFGPGRNFRQRLPVGKVLCDEFPDSVVFRRVPSGFTDGSVVVVARRSGLVAASGLGRVVGSGPHAERGSPVEHVEIERTAVVEEITQVFEHFLRRNSTVGFAPVVEPSRIVFGNHQRPCGHHTPQRVERHGCAYRFADGLYAVGACRDVCAADDTSCEQQPFGGQRNDCPVGDAVGRNLLEVYGQVFQLSEVGRVVGVGDLVVESFDMIDTLFKSAQIYLSGCAMGFKSAGMSDAQMQELKDTFNL